MFGGPPFGQRIGGNVNLSTASSTSFASLLDNVRAERQQREETARVEKAVRVIQGRWRAGREGKVVRAEVVRMLGLEEGQESVGEGMEVEGQGVGEEGIGGDVRGLVKGVVVSRGWKGEAERRRRAEWARRAVLEGAEIDPSGIPIVLEPVSHSADHQSIGVIVAILLLAALDSIAITAQSSDTPQLLAAMETLLDRRHYTRLNTGAGGQGALADAADVLSRNGWVEGVVGVMQQLIATNTPKKKNPSLPPLIRLVLAPLSIDISLSTPPPTSVLEPLITHLLTIPSLPTSIPIPALTYLSDKLNLFTILLPHLASHPSSLTSTSSSSTSPQSYSAYPATTSGTHNPLISEHGKTYLLANLVTFGITGQMLARSGAQGKKSWVQVLSDLLESFGEEWGRWVDGVVDEEDVDMLHNAEEDSEDEDAEDPTLSARAASNTVAPTNIAPLKSLRPRQTRPLLPPKISAKLLLLPSSAHIAQLVDMVASPSAKASTADLLALTGMVAQLLRVFRGTPKWEGILDALLQGRAGKQLFKRVWRECVRGRWGDSASQSTWERFGTNPHAPPLRLLSYIFNHFLLLAPDDEFFDPAYNPLSMDEVRELSVIWRDLAFWGYMAGVSSRAQGEAVGAADTRGSEEDRGLFTRGVTRLTERNARRPFTPEDHWPMPGLKDLSGFVEAAVLEDAKLFNPSEEDMSGGANGEDGQEGMDRRRLAARQRFSKRQVAFMSPRLGLLNNLPMAVPFVVRLKVFDQLVKADAQRIGADMPSRRSRFFNRATIRRDRLAEDGFRTLNPLGPYMKGHIQITFINEFGEEEAGIDGGGLFKEFLTSLSRDAFDSARGLWLFTDQNELYPNPHSYATEQHQLSWYAFLGRVLGKAIYDGILVDVSFAGFFLAKWLGRQSYLDDLASLDRDLYKGLIVLKNYDKPEDLALNFTLTEEEFGVPKTIDLVPGGSDIAVTAENRHEYIQLVCRYKLDRRISLQSRAFFNGLSEIVDDKWLRMFDQHELRQVIGGEETPIDVEDLKANTAITGFAHDDTVKLFWRVVARFSQVEKRALLKFVTSCERPPLLGFGHLNPKFGIRSNGSDTDRLPSASSCFNLLKLPEYKDEKTLKSKLLQAITSGAGFDLS